jgi:hypothetical protein
MEGYIMKYRLFIWSTAMENGAPQGLVDLVTKDAALDAYLYFCNMGWTGKNKITCVELYTIDENDESAELLYSSTFPE